MQIPPFPKPSNLKDVVFFRVPNVEDALLFTNLMTEQEQQNTTQFLNHIQDTSRQDGKINDSINWTNEDRRSALWWIFCASNETPTMSVSYYCKHCKEDHYIDVNLPDLGDNALALNQPPISKIEAHFNGTLIKGIEVRPLDGFACEELEIMQIEHDGYLEGSKDRAAAKHRIYLSEIAFNLRFPDEPEDRREAQDYRVDKIREMKLDTEFRSLVSKIEIELRAMRHGLLVKRGANGKTYLVHTQESCKKAVASGEEPSKLMLLPFRSNDYMPKI